MKTPQTADHNKLPNRRQEPRLAMHFPSLLIQPKKEVYTTVVNLSENGIGFLSAIKISKDEDVLISFECVKSYRLPSIDLKVHVRTCHEVDSEYYIGGNITSKPLNYTKFFKFIELGTDA